MAMKNTEQCCCGESGNGDGDLTHLIKQFHLLNVSIKHRCESLGNKWHKKKIKHGLEAFRNE